MCLLEVKLELVLCVSKVVPVHFVFNVYYAQWLGELNGPGRQLELVVDRDSDNDVRKMIGLIIELMRTNVDPNKECVFLTSSLV